MTNLPTLDEANIKGHFDEDEGISYISYSGKVSHKDTQRLYEWVRELIGVIGTDATHAVIFDFREVESFAPNNLSTTRRESKNINQNKEAVNHPVALVVDSLYQEQMVRVSMKITPDESRKRIVKSMDEAKAFIDEWHAQNN